MTDQQLIAFALVRLRDEARTRQFIEQHRAAIVAWFTAHKEKQR